MIVQHNLQPTGMYTLAEQTKVAQTKLNEKMSVEHQKFNRAVDAVIAERFRRQVQNLNQTSANYQDGASMVQVADGAMSKIQSMIDHCTELSVKASSGTLSPEDRFYIQREIRELKSQINSVKHNASYRNQPVLGGNAYAIENGTTEVVGLSADRFSNEEDRFGMLFPNAADLDLSSLDVSTAESATASVDILKQAADYVSNERNRLAGYQTSIAFTIDSLSSDNTSEDTFTASLENIADQADAAMMAQSNISNLDVLSLLQ